ncbi:MAG: hypothetical protein QM296_07570 [Bacillota bacterium]|nr:hypothetical protein [Bacillota bacterium]
MLGPSGRNILGSGYHICEAQLGTDTQRLQTTHRDADEAQGQINEFFLSLKEFRGRAIDLRGRMDRQRQAALSGRGLKAAAAVDQLDGSGSLLLFFKPPGDLFRQLPQQRRGLCQTQKIRCRRAHRPDRAGRLLLALELHLITILPTGGQAQLTAVAAKEPKERLGIHLGQVADRVDRQPVQALGQYGSDKEHALHRQRPQKPAVVLPADDGDGIRFAVVGAELRKSQSKGDTYGHGQPELCVYNMAYLMGDPDRLRQRQVLQADPAFIQTHRAQPLRVAAVDRHGPFRGLLIERPLRRQDNRRRTLAQGVDQGLSGLHGTALGDVVFGQHNTAPLGNVATYNHGAPRQIRTFQELDGGKEVVHVHMQDPALCCHTSMIRDGSFVMSKSA